MKETKGPKSWNKMEKSDILISPFSTNVTRNKREDYTGYYTCESLAMNFSDLVCENKCKNILYLRYCKL